MKKTLSFLVITLFAFSCAKTEIEISNKYAIGTEQNPHLISSLEDLKEFAEQVNSGTSFEGEFISLTKSLDLEGSEQNQWTAIGYYTNSSDKSAFKGTFNGNNNTISGLYINTDVFYQGLFGFAEDCEISNLTIEGEILGSSSVVGAVVGWMVNGKISNCTANASLQGFQYGGGIVGNTDNSTIENCRNLGYVNFGDSSVGGIAGQVNTGTIINCYNTATIKAEGFSVGGILGYDVNNVTLINCYNAGAVSGGGKDVGGVAGSVSTLTNCYNTGAVSGGGKNVGGVAGSASALTNCYNTGAVSGGSDFVGGVAGSGSTLTNCYSLSGCVTQGSGGSDDEQKDEEYLKFLYFAIWLNNNAYNYNLTSPSVEACAWVYNNDAYPSLSYAVAPEYNYFLDGTGTYGDPLKINSAEDLAFLAQQINAGLLVDLYYKQTQDITLEGEWTPIGTNTSPFTGNYNGAGFSIEGLSITSEGDYKGLFGLIAQDACVGNVAIKSGEINCSGDNVGAIAGRNQGMIYSCYNLIDVKGGTKVGGIAGSILGTLEASTNSGLIEACYNKGAISGTENVGGIAGENSSGKIYSTFSIGSITGDSYVAGIAGSQFVGTCTAGYTNYNNGVIYNTVSAPVYCETYTSELMYASTGFCDVLNNALSSDAWKYEFGYAYPQLINNMESDSSSLVTVIQ